MVFKSRYATVPRIRQLLYGQVNGVRTVLSRVTVEIGRRYTTWVADPTGVSYTTAEGDSMAALAQRFYGDATVWWVIADANPHVLYPLDLPKNTLLSIPSLRTASLLAR